MIRLVLLVAFGWSATAGAVHRVHELTNGPHHCAVCVVGHTVGAPLPVSSFDFAPNGVERAQDELAGSFSVRSYRIVPSPARSPPTIL